MSETRRGRRGYHHGNLKEALVDAGRRLIAEKGPQGFTMAEAARLAGVSPSAPYRHFNDRDALLAEIAHLGFVSFADRLERARADPKHTPLQALDAVGRAYLAFAREEPAAFAAMFEAGIDLAKASSELGRAADRAFETLMRAVAAVIAGAPPEKRSPVMMATMHIWATSHGVAALYGRGGRSAPMSAEEMLESACGVYLRGLGLLPD